MVLVLNSLVLILFDLINMLIMVIGNHYCKIELHHLLSTMYINKQNSLSEYTFDKPLYCGLLIVLW